MLRSAAIKGPSLKNAVFINKVFSSTYTGVPKKMFRQDLFENKVPLSYKKVIDTMVSCRDDKQLPRKIDATHLMLIKKALESFRKRTGSIKQENVFIERSLVERAAELGDATAIAILAGDTLSDPKSTQDDKDHADKLLLQLMNEKFPLAFKVSGDLSYKMGLNDVALQFYNKAIETGLADRSIRAECLRSIGLLSFHSRDFLGARKNFEEAIELSTSVSQVADCHYYLGQLYEQDKRRAMYHFEKAASGSLKEAYTPIGFLYLNYFNEPELAYEWFTLGAQIGEADSLVGLFDVCMKKQDYVKAYGYLNKIKEADGAEALLAARTEQIEVLSQNLELHGAQEDSDQPAPEQIPQKSDRWGF